MLTLCRELSSAFVAYMVSAPCLPEHKSAETTMIYTHVMSKGNLSVESPLDIFREEKDL